MSRSKLALGVGVGLVVVIGGAAYWLATSLDGIVARRIEAALERTTGTPCSVGSVSISVRSGEGTVRNLRIGNPEGYASGAAAEFGEVRFKLDLASLRSQPVVVNEVVIAASSIRLELDPKGQSNLDVIRRHAEQAGGAAASEGPPVKLRIVSLDIERGALEADLTAAGGRTQRLELDAFHRTNMGGQAGATPDVLAKELVTDLAKQAARAALKAGISKVIEEQTRGVKDRIKGLFNRK